MRIATITNWAYGATVCLTIASGIIMLMASSADTLERQAVEQRQKFDQLTEDIETDIWAQSDLARLYVWGGDRFCMVVMWGKKGAEAMNDGGCEAR